MYSPLPTIDPAEGRLTVTLGQQTLPFGLEANTTDELRPVISSAQFLSPTGLGRREIGLIFRGDLGITYDYGYNYRSSLLSYNVGLVNGNGPNTADNNNYKDIVARIDAKVPTDYNSWLRELRFGVSGYKGRQVLTNAAPAVTAQGNRSRYGFDVYYNHYPFGVTYEYVVTFDEALAAAGTRQPEARGDSHTATLFYNFGQQFLSSKSQGRFDDWWPKTYQPFFRYDRYDPNNEISSNQTDIYTVGFNIFFAETTKFQLNLSRKIEHRPATLASNDSFATNEILTQLQYGF